MLLNIPFDSLPYEEHVAGKEPQALRFEADSLGDLLSTAKVPCAAGFVPVHMQVVGGSSQRGDIPARVCLLGKDRATYKVYALPRNWGPMMNVVLQEDLMMDD